MGWQMSPLVNRMPAFCHPWEIFSNCLLLLYLCSCEGEISWNFGWAQPLFLWRVRTFNFILQTHYPFDRYNVKYSGIICQPSNAVWLWAWTGWKSTILIGSHRQDIFTLWHHIVGAHRIVGVNPPIADYGTLPHPFPIIKYPQTKQCSRKVRPTFYQPTGTKVLKGISKQNTPALWTQININMEIKSNYLSYNYTMLATNYNDFERLWSPHRLLNIAPSY